MITKVTGFIVSTVSYKDTSLILNLFTKEYGLIGVLGKGVKSLKSPLRALTQKFTYGFFYIYYKENKLSILKDVDILNPFITIHSDIFLIGYLNYVSELVVQVYKESENKELFDLFLSIVFKMNEGLDAEVLTNIFEIKCLPFLGVGIVLDGCSECGNTKDIVTIDGDAGGFLCKNCYSNEKIVSLKTIQLLRMYAYIDIKSIKNLDIKNPYKKEIDMFLSIYYGRYTGVYLKSKDFINKLKEL